MYTHKVGKEQQAGNRVPYWDITKMKDIRIVAIEECLSFAMIFGESGSNNAKSYD